MLSHLYYGNSPWVSCSHSPSLVYVWYSSIHLAWCCCCALSRLLPFISPIAHDNRSSNSRPLSLFLDFNLSFTRIKAAGSFVPGILATRIISLSSWQAFSLDLDSFIGNIHLHSSSSVVDIRQTGIYLFLFFLFSHCLAHALSLFLSFSLSLALAFSLKIPFSRIIWAALDTDILYQ